MPLPEGTRYAVTTTKSGKKIRLAFKKGAPRHGAEPIEAKSLSSGKTHTSEEFARDRRNRASRLKARRR